MAKIARTLRNRKGQEGLRDNQFNRILHLEREKGRGSLEIWQNATN